MFYNLMTFFSVCARCSFFFVFIYTLVVSAYTLWPYSGNRILLAETVTINAQFAHISMDFIGIDKYWSFHFDTNNLCFSFGSFFRTFSKIPFLVISFQNGF